MEIAGLKAPSHIDPKEHQAAMLALGMREALGMAMPANIQPTPGLLSYLHDPSRRQWTWHAEYRLEYGSE